ncbi:MAG: 1,4-alpha-glucan branching protein GlgB [Chloroflexi bacterium]|nr:1,4-alpha-glucan branching protein GlgB [Chloroflexota bacterium]
MTEIDVLPRQATLLTSADLHYFNEGSHYALYRKLGAHPATVSGTRGTFFSVWAPDAEAVGVMGDFNGWNPAANLLAPRGSSGIWESFIPGVEKGAQYKYHVASRVSMYRIDKTDPMGFFYQEPPSTASIVWDLDYTWGDGEWMARRRSSSGLDRPVAIYEVHLGSWKRVPEQNARYLTYREMAEQLVDYVKEMGFTHVEFLPVMEHPFYGSWGYQTTGYFAPSSRYGAPQDFMYLVDKLHQSGIGVILDWVPSHFPKDGHGLGFFDGTHLYEHEDPRRGIHPDWDSFIFNYGRNEVRSFLLSSAMFWLDVYHADGLRVDAVASMLYLDYSRKAGEWIPNQFGGRENLEAIAFLRRFNEAIYKEHPDTHMIAEESTAWPMVSRPTYIGGLGFGLKWDMGWMHDMLEYVSHDPVHRKYHHNNITFRMLYAFYENFILPLSHDEVVHGKGSLLGRMPGDDREKFANLRLLLGYMYGQCGKKLLFMGGEFGQWNEWYHETSLDWHLLDFAPHRGVQQWVRDLNRLYVTEPCMHELDHDPEGFEWVDCADSDQSTISFIRRGKSTGDIMFSVCNFTPVLRENYIVGVPSGGYWKEMLNSDGAEYGGSGAGNAGGCQAVQRQSHGRPFSVKLTLPPLAILFLKSQG